MIQRRMPDAFTLCFVALLVVHVGLMLSLRIYPFQDTPNHLAAATIYRFYGENDNAFERYYGVGRLFPQPNVFHLLFTGSRLFPSVETANRLFYASAVALLPLSVLLVIRAIGGNPWMTVLSFLLVYNLSTSGGFVGFTIALPTLLVLVYAAARLVRRDDATSRVAAAALLVVLFVMHAQAALFAIAYFVLVCIYSYHRMPGRMIRRVLLAAPVLALIGAWWVLRGAESGPGLAENLITYYRDRYVATLVHRGGWFVFDNQAIYPGRLGHVVAGLCSLAVAVPVIAWVFADRRSLVATLTDRHQGPVTILAGWAFFCVLFLPERIAGQQIIYQRFSVLFLASLILIGALGPWRQLGRLAIVGLCAVAVVYSAARAEYFLTFQAEAADFTPELLPEPRGGGEARLFGLVYDAHYRGRPVYIHFPNYYVVWRHGIAGARLIDYRFGTVRRRADLEALPAYKEFLYLTPYEGEYTDMEYLLVRGTPPPAAARYLAPFEPVRRSGRWTLYHRASRPRVNRSSS